jgi:hypothetical protein
MVYAVCMALGIERANRPLLSLFHAARALPWLCAATLLAACGNKDGGDDNTGSEANAILTDENNYQSTTRLTMSTLEVAADTDVEVCWDQVTTDLLCHELTPKRDVDHVSLLRFKDMPESEVEGQLASGQLSMPDINGYFEYETDHDVTCVKLSAMGLYGTKINVGEDFVADNDFTYVLLAAKGTTPGVGTQSMTFVKPTSSSDATTANVPEGCDVLKFTADLQSAKKVSIPAEGPWLLDWSKMKHDATGNDIAFESIDSVLLGFYEGMTVGEIQSKIKDLELIATTLWEVEISGEQSVDLADTKERTDSGKAGDRFPGFTSTDGVWLVGLMCSSCQSPAPVALAVLDPQGGD